MSKRFFRSLLSSLLAVMMVVSFAAVPSLAAPAISKSSVTLTKGYSTTLSVSGASGSVSWSTGDKSVATVSSKGKVSGKGIGSTYIYAKTGGQTLKCKVTVVAGKISASKSSVSLEKGEKATITIKAIGTHALTVNSTNASVVKAGWGSKKFNGDTISLVLTATGVGTARVKVYASKYSSTVYKYIDVTVEGDDYFITDGSDGSSGSSGGSGTAAPAVEFALSTKSVSVKAGETYPIYVYGANNIRYDSANHSVATVTASSSSSTSKILNIKGEAAGTTTVRVLNSDTSKYLDVSVTVTGGAQYYTVLDSQPSKINANDISATIEINGSTKFMLVPYDANYAMKYDVSKVNDAVAAYEKASRYYSIYSNVPNKKAATDQIVPVTMTVNNQFVYKCMLVPQDYDQPTADTIIAEYKGSYEYNTVYTKSPTKKYSTDYILPWEVTMYDSAKNKNVVSQRYLLVPYNYDKDAANSIIDKDKNKYQSYQEYVVLTTAPKYDAKTHELIIWTNDKSGKVKFMLVPKTNCDYVKRNDVIYSDTGVYCYYNAYSTDPRNSIALSDYEQVISGLHADTGKMIYILINTRDPNYDTKLNNALSGGAFSSEKRLG